MLFYSKLGCRTISENTQVSLPLVTDARRSLESYYVGPNTELLHILTQLTHQSQVRMVFLYGPTGTGKSHLLNGVITSSGVSGNYIPLSVPGAGLDLLTTIDKPMLVCFDDAEKVSTDAQVERNLLGLYERVMAQNGWIVVSSQFSPSQSGIKLKDLVSRFNSGLVYRIKELNDEQKAEAFSWAARRRGLELTEETVTWVLRRAPRETQSLFLLLDKIDQTALQTGERVTIPFLRKHKILESRLIA